MTRGVKRRLAQIEELMPLPINAERFVARARRRARRTGKNVEASMAAVAQELSDAELESVAAELEKIVFGSDTAARDAAKREVFAAMGCPDLDKNNLNGTEACAW